MTMNEPTLTPPMAPSTVDMAESFAAHAERATRTLALRHANKDRLFESLMAAGVTHVTVTFDGARDSGQIEYIGAWSGQTVVDLPATEIPYATLPSGATERSICQLSLAQVVAQLACEFLCDLQDDLESNGGTWGAFCFDAAARCIHLEFNESVEISVRAHPVAPMVEIL